MKFSRLREIFPAKLLGLGLLALLLSAFVERYVEERRAEDNLTWTDPESQQALEAGFLALGGFRGVLADVLWIRALHLQESGQYYELKLLCDVIQKLQPTFAQVHAFQAHNMGYNLAAHAQSPEDRWYWIRSGLATLEKGLARSKRNYSLWFELGMHYFDRLGPNKIGDCKALMLAQLPRIDDLTEEQRITVFSGPQTWATGRARPNENFYFAAYCFFKAIQTETEVRPLRTERMYGQMLMHLGLYISKRPAAELTRPGAQVAFDDWGAEDWWLELLKRNKARGIPDKLSGVPDNLRFTMYKAMYLYNARAATGADPVLAQKYRRLRDEAYARFREYFPDDRRGIGEILRDYQDYRKRRAARGLNPE